MTTMQNIDDLIGRDVYDSDGDKIGSVSDVYLDNESGEPTWVTVKTGWFGLRESFIPLDRIDESGTDLHVPYGKAKVKDSPNFDAGEPLSPDDEENLYTYYGLSTQGPRTGEPAGTTASADRPAGRTGIDEPADRGTGTVGRQTEGAMTRSEEQLNVSTERVPASRARLRKYVVTEDRQVRVPVQREEVRIEREPITDENRDAALSGPDIAEREHEVTLTEERPVVTTEAVPVERVRMDTETVTDEQTVTGQVRKEKVDVENSDQTRQEESRRLDR